MKYDDDTLAVLDVHGGRIVDTKADEPLNGVIVGVVNQAQGFLVEGAGAF